MNTMITAAVIVLAVSPFDEPFDRAGAAFDNGDFVLAAQIYEQMISEGVVHPVLFHNLATAYYRMGSSGPAIANYERALDLRPGFPEALDGLRACVSGTPSKTDRPAASDWEQSLLFWHYGLSPRAVSIGAAISWWALWIVLALRKWKPFPGAWFVAAVLAALAAACFASAWAKSHPATRAVVAAERVEVRFAPSDMEPKRFELTVGDPVTVARRQEGWSLLTAASGLRGWVRDSSLAFVGPPYEPYAAKEAVSR